MLYKKVCTIICYAGRRAVQLGYHRRTNNKLLCTCTDRFKDYQSKTFLFSKRHFIELVQIGSDRQLVIRFTLRQPLLQQCCTITTTTVAVYIDRTGNQQKMQKFLRYMVENLVIAVSIIAYYLRNRRGHRIINYERTPQTFISHVYQLNQILINEYQVFSQKNN